MADTDLQLYIACGYGHADAAQDLIENEDANVNYQNERFGYSCLHRAARKGFIEIMGLLIDAGADVNVRGSNAVTPLHLAAYYGNDDSVVFLLENDADIHAINEYGRNPLESAIYTNQGTAADILREAWEALHPEEEVELEDAEEEAEPEEELEEDPEEELEEDPEEELEEDPEEELEQDPEEELEQDPEEELEEDPEEELEEDPEEELEEDPNEELDLPPEYHHHVFLTHNWGIDQTNHSRVAMMNHELKKYGVRTWFDEERLEGNIIEQISEGISSSMAVIIFVTPEYITKVSGNGSRGPNDYCKLELEYAWDEKGIENMIVVECEDTDGLWSGTNLGFLLGRHLRYSFKNDDELTTCAQSLLAKIAKIQQRIANDD